MVSEFVKENISSKLDISIQNKPSRVNKYYYYCLNE